MVVSRSLCPILSGSMNVSISCPYDKNCIKCALHEQFLIAMQSCYVSLSACNLSNDCYDYIGENIEGVCETYEKSDF